MRKIILVIALFSSGSHAAELEEVSLPNDGWYQIQKNGVTLCETGQLQPCLLAPGIYTRINHTIGERDGNYEVVATVANKQILSTRILEEEPVSIAEMYCGDSGTTAVAITCHAFVRDENNERRIVLTNGYISAPDYLEPQSTRYDYDAACIPEEPAYVRATLFCAPISSYTEYGEDWSFTVFIDD